MVTVKSKQGVFFVIEWELFFNNLEVTEKLAYVMLILHVIHISGFQSCLFYGEGLFK
jgi:hypothetical protein